MMQTLYPIIRRVRRPLLVTDAPPVVVGNVEPVEAVAGLGNIQQPTSNIEHPTEQPPGHGKASDEEVSTQSDAS
jgi:hypothetical protein